MITQILKEMEKSSQPVTLQYLSHKLGLEESALEGMIEFLINKGIVRDSSPCATEFHKINAVPHCPGCAGCTHCEVQITPKIYSLTDKK